MDLQASEIRFAQQLAGNEQKQRNKSLKKLKKYLQAKSASKKNGFTHEDFLKIWKGLHYCMWMQDKPIIQEELCRKITQMVHDLATVEAKCLFIQVFIETEAREWNGLDVWRVDKFMMLFRAMLTESLVMLKNQGWKKKPVTDLLNIYKELLLNANEDKVPHGLRSHFVDIFVDEVHRVGGSKIKTEQFLTLLDPFISYIQTVKDEEWAQKVVKKIFDPLIERTAKLAENKGKTEEEAESIVYPDLQLDVKVIIDHLFDAGKSGETPARKRELFYGLVKRFQDADDGIVAKPLEFPKGPAITNQMVGEAMLSLKQLQTQKSEKLTRKELKKIKKKRKLLVLGLGKENSSTDVEPTENISTDDTKVIVGKKRKHSEPESSEEPVKKVKKKDKNKQNTAEAAKETKPDDYEKSEKEKSNKAKDKKFKKKSLGKSENDLSEMKDKMKASTNNEDITVVKLDGQVVKEKKQDNGTTVEKDISDSSVKKDKGENVEVEDTNNGKKNTNGKTIKGNAKSAKKRKIDQTDGVSSSKVAETSKCDTDSKINTVSEISQVTNTGSESKPESEPIKTDKSMIKIKPSEDLEEGEVEIFVPSKKYKGRISMSPAKFADFETSKTPVAFVKRALSKTNKMASGTPAYVKKKAETPGSGLTGSAKKVYFNMKKNQSQSFKDSLKSPIVPFNPAKTPDQSILKTPTRNTPSTDNVRRSARKGSTNTPPSSGNLKTLKTPKRTLALKQVRTTTPKMSLQATLKRKTAADFFAL